MENYNETLNNKKNKLENIRGKYQMHKHAIIKVRTQDGGEIDRIL